MKIKNSFLQILLIFSLCSVPMLSHAQLKVFSFSEIEVLQENEARNVFVLIYTDWCKYCEIMQNTSLKNQEIIHRLNQDFYFVSLNAEEKNDIQFAGKTFQFKPTGRNTGVHELAITLGEINGKINYPSLVLLNPKNEIIFQYQGFITTAELKNILKISTEN